MDVPEYADFTKEAANELWKEEMQKNGLTKYERTYNEIYVDFR
jgi:hypothetical protein